MAQHLCCYPVSFLGPSLVCTRRTDQVDIRFLVYYLDVSGQMGRFLICHNLAHVAGWDPYNVRDVEHVYWVDLHYADLAQHPI